MCVILIHFINLIARHLAALLHPCSCLDVCVSVEVWTYILLLKSLCLSKIHFTVTGQFCMDYEIFTIVVYESLKFVSNEICTVPMSFSLLLHLNVLNGNRYTSILSNCVTKLCSYSVVIVFRVHLFALIYLWIYLFIMWCIFELYTLQLFMIFSCFYRLYILIIISWFKKLKNF